MASVDPPIPAAAADSFVARSESVDNVNGAGTRLRKWRRTMGLLMIALVVVLWTASNFLASVCPLYTCRCRIMNSSAKVFTGCFSRQHVQ